MARVITTYLEMRAPHELAARRTTDEHWWIGKATTPQWQFNRFLYSAVGGDWEWTDKSGWSEEDWRSYLESPNLHTFAAYYDASPAGYYELLQDPEGGVEIAYFGLLRPFILEQRDVQLGSLGLELSRLCMPPPLGPE